MGSGKMGLSEGDINELEASPKAYQLSSTIRAVVGVDVDLFVTSWSDSFEIFACPMDHPLGARLYDTTVVKVSGDVAVVKYTNMDFKIRGKGIYSLGAEFRDRVALKFGFKRLLSTIRADNSRMVKAAKKNRWTLVSDGEVGLWLKEDL